MLSYSMLSCPILSVLCYLIVCYPVCPMLSCPVCPMLSSPALNYPVLSCPVLSCSVHCVFSGLSLCCCILSYHVLPIPLSNSAHNLLLLNSFQVCVWYFSDVNSCYVPWHWFYPMISFFQTSWLSWKHQEVEALSSICPLCQCGGVHGYMISVNMFVDWTW